MSGPNTTADAVRQILMAHRQELNKPNVLSVRPGWEYASGWLTGRRAIVATVDRKTRLEELSAADRLPDQIDGVPVDVRQASARKRLELTDPARYASELRLSPDLGSVPHFADEISPSGATVGVGASAHTAFAALTASKPRLPYAPPASAPLSPITDTVTIHLAASPDAGWTMLAPFIAGVTTAMTIGLYDFTSQHVLAAVTAALASKSLKLTLDHPATNPTADQTDAATVATLATAVGSGLDQAWALSGMDPEATATIFATAYHIKVAVADSTRFWLSSGNWNNSNQPAINPVGSHTGSAEAEAARHGDRDWHVIVEHPALAQTFESYLVNDLQVAAAHNAPPEQPGPPLPPPGTGTTTTPAFEEFFGATTITDTMTLTPLLTPDPGVYVNAVKELIASAQTSLWMQFQYIEPPRTIDASSQPFVDLITAVIDRQNAGVDVRIITSEFQSAGYLEQLQSLGLDVATLLKIQNNVHNKGIIVDGKRVLVSSQNWSTDGTLYNRDAGLIIDHPEAATYFATIFTHDWNHLAHQRAAED